MRNFALTFAALAVLCGIVAFSPVPAALAGVVKMLGFAFALLALISLVAHLSLDRSDPESTPKSEGDGLYRGPLDRD